MVGIGGGVWSRPLQGEETEGSYKKRAAIQNCISPSLVQDVPFSLWGKVAKTSWLAFLPPLTLRVLKKGEKN